MRRASERAISQELTQQGGQRGVRQADGLSPPQPKLEVVGSPLEWDPLGELRALEPIGFLPRVDLKETSDTFVLIADVPGMSEHDVQVDVAGDRVLIRGERPDDAQQSDPFYRRERPWGPFQRVIELPGGTDAKQVTAAIINGVLRVVLPKLAEQCSRSIRIQNASTDSDRER